MTEDGLTLVFEVDRSPEEVLAAVRDVRGWWSEGVEGAAAAVGDTFTYRHGDLHESSQRLVEDVPGRRLVWLVTAARLGFTGDPHEWEGTRLRFEVARERGRTELRFTHQGLVRGLECFEACSKGWGYYVGESLRSLITTGRGRPDPRALAHPSREASAGRGAEASSPGGR